MATRRGDAWSIIIGLIALIFVGSLLGGAGQSDPRSAPEGSSHSLGPDGLYAIYSVFDDQGMARRWTLPLDQLDGRVDRMVIWDVDALGPEDLQALEEWVGHGHAALLGGPVDGLEGSIGLESAGVARPAAAHAATLGVEEVAVGSGRFRGGTADRLIHLKDADGRPILVSWRVGDGRIFWSADTEWLTNRRIAEAQNLDLALQILLPSGGGQVAFDEYHHGYVSARHWWQILRGSLHAFLLLLSAAVALLFWACGARFGSPRPAPATPPRAAVEYVYSMSQLYRRARAGGVVLQALHRSLLARLGRLTGGVQGLTHAEIARRAAQRCGVPAEEIEQLLNQTAPYQNAQPSEAELIALARKAEGLQRRIEHAGYRDL